MRGALTVPANPWELRADVRPLEAAAQRWEELGALMGRRGDATISTSQIRMPMHGAMPRRIVSTSGSS